MAVIRLDNASLAYGDTPLLSDVSLFLLDLSFLLDKFMLNHKILKEVFISELEL